MWRLYAFSENSQTSGAHQEFYLLRDASVQEVESVRAAIKDLADHSIREAFVLVVYNFEQFHETEVEIIDTIASSPRSEWPEPSDFVHTLRMHFLNWLLSTRSFLEQTEIQLKRRYGKESAEVRAFQAAASNEYDSRFSYRFLYKLRNYAQHCGYPPLSGRIQFDEDQNPQRWIELFFDKETLLRYNGWGSVRKELEAFPEEIPLDDHLEKTMDSLAEIAARARDIDTPSLRESLRILGAYWNELGTRTGRPCFLRGDDMREGFDVLWIPYRPMLSPVTIKCET